MGKEIVQYWGLVLIGCAEVPVSEGNDLIHDVVEFEGVVGGGEINCSETLSGLTSDGISQEDSFIGGGWVGCAVRIAFGVGFDMLEASRVVGMIEGVTAGGPETSSGVS